MYAKAQQRAMSGILTRDSLPIWSPEQWTQGRTALLNGVFGWQRAPGAKGWRFFWFDFPSKVNKVPEPAR